MKVTMYHMMPTDWARFMLGMSVEKRNAHSVNAVRLKKKKTKYLQKINMNFS
jgi:hypothetical protein